MSSNGIAQYARQRAALNTTAPLPTSSNDALIAAAIMAIEAAGGKVTFTQPVSVGGSAPPVKPRTRLRLTSKAKSRNAAGTTKQALALQVPTKQAPAGGGNATLEAYGKRARATGQAPDCPWCAAKGAKSVAASVEPHGEGRVKVKFAGCKHTANVNTTERE